MSASFASALRAAHDAASAQDYPQATLYVVATPIGNLADITLRALHVLQLVDAIACEDTRHSQALLRAYGIDRAAGSWIAAHQHNEQQAAERVLERLAAGERVAYVSDAGTPAVSDPGARLAAAVRAAGHRVLPLPGASAVTTALSAAGAVAVSGDAGFVFAGFLPAKAGERQRALAVLAGERRPVVLLEAPHRIAALAQALAALGGREVTLARELTKHYESLATLPADHVVAWLAEDPTRTRGEFTVVLHPAPAAVPAETDGETDRVLRLLLQELPLKTAARTTAAITGAARNVLYERGLQWRLDGDPPP